MGFWVASEADLFSHDSRSGGTQDERGRRHTVNVLGPSLSIGKEGRSWLRTDDKG